MQYIQTKQADVYTNTAVFNPILLLTTKYNLSVTSPHLWQNGKAIYLLDFTVRSSLTAEPCFRFSLEGLFGKYSALLLHNPVSRLWCKIRSWKEMNAPLLVLTAALRHCEQIDPSCSLCQLVPAISFCRSVCIFFLCTALSLSVTICAFYHLTHSCVTEGA